MRVVIGVFLVFLLASCATGPDDAAVNVSNASQEPVDDPVNDTVVPVNDIGNVSNATGNVSIPRARLNDSVLGFVPSDDPTPRIVSFSLISGLTDRVIPEYANMTGTVRIDRERVPNSLALRANYAGDVGSVLFGLDDDENYRVENAPPYAMNGDEYAVYDSWYPAKGRYEITATPFSREDGFGEEFDTLTLIIEFYAEDYLDRVNVR